MMFFDMVLGWARRELVLVLSARLDVRLNLHVFGRLLSLPLDFFERSQAGETISRLREVFRVRDFLTGKLLYTFLDGFTLLVMLPFMFYMEPTLAWVSVAIAGLIALIIMVFLRPVGALIALAIQAQHKNGRGDERDGLRHTHREIPGARAAAEGDLGRACGRCRPLAPGRRPSGQLAADADRPAADLHVRGVVLFGAYPRFAKRHHGGSRAG